LRSNSLPSTDSKTSTSAWRFLSSFWEIWTFMLVTRASFERSSACSMAVSTASRKEPISSQPFSDSMAEQWAQSVRSTWSARETMECFFE
jgi:hypothetical protein